jgi:hypothetical protein
MFSLETIGYYSSVRGSQQYPGRVSPGCCFRMPETSSVSWQTSLHVGCWRRRRGVQTPTKFPSEGAAAPVGIPGVGWSDHWSFWQEGYEAVMITDTARIRIIVRRPTHPSSSKNRPDSHYPCSGFGGPVTAPRTPRTPRTCRTCRTRRTCRTPTPRLPNLSGSPPADSRHQRAAHPECTLQTCSRQSR